jgi:hypothetical protein
MDNPVLDLMGNSLAAQSIRQCYNTYGSPTVTGLFNRSSAFFQYDRQTVDLFLGKDFPDTFTFAA